MKALQAELVALLESRILKHLHDLQLSNLIRDLLPRQLTHFDNFLSCICRAHGHVDLEEINGLIWREYSQCNLHIYDYPYRPQAHLVVDDLPRVRAVDRKRT